MRNSPASPVNPLGSRSAGSSFLSRSSRLYPSRLFPDGFIRRDRHGSIRHDRHDRHGSFPASRSGRRMPCRKYPQRRPSPPSTRHLRLRRIQRSRCRRSCCEPSPDTRSVGRRNSRRPTARSGCNSGSCTRHRIIRAAESVKLCLKHGVAVIYHATLGMKKPATRWKRRKSGASSRRRWASTTPH